MKIFLPEIDPFLLFFTFFPIAWVQNSKDFFGKSKKKIFFIQILKFFSFLNYMTSSKW